MQPREPEGPNPSPDSESLLRRLAGPSVNKAGLAKDQTEINRIIAEVSKGSKFYDNEKRKDRDLTERILRILKHRDEVLKGVDIRNIEQGVDQLIAKLEAQRDLSQIIVHVDMDAFFANVELLDNPNLQGKSFAVGGGVISTASYEARKFGVRSGMATFIAKKLCPDLILMESHYDRYSEMSNQIMNIFRRYDPNMCLAGCDEGYLNITAYCEDHLLDAEQCVQEMRETVHGETKLTVSAGIAPNKMLAKICSDKNKPNGQYKLDFDPVTIKQFMKDLSIRKVPGVGRVNERLLDSIGIKTCGDIYEHRGVLSLMDKQFGLRFLLQAYLGIASNVVRPGQREERKSIGAERTFSPLGDKDAIFQKLQEVAAELESDMVHNGWTGKTVTLKYKLDTYQVFTRARSFDRWISTSKEDLFEIGKELLLPELPLSLRLIGLRVTKLKDLKAEAAQKSSGIKRFFQSAGPSSPKKRPRVVLDDPNDDEFQTLDGFEDAMPGFHEHAEVDDTHGTLNQPQACQEETGSESARTNEISYVPKTSEQQSRPRPRPPVSAPASSSSPKTTSSRLTKPLSSATVPSSSFATAAGSVINSGGGSEGAAEHICPICSKTLRTDNTGLNAHIDFCLSKETIQEAQASASVASVRSGFVPERRSTDGKGSKTRSRTKGTGRKR